MDELYYNHGRRTALEKLGMKPVAKAVSSGVDEMGKRIPTRIPIIPRSKAPLRRGQPIESEAAERARTTYKRDRSPRDKLLDEAAGD
jgi:hypothetical protein